MSNQLLLWSMLILPWLTLFIMPVKDVKRYISVGLLSGFMSILVSEAGVANGWWYFRETTYPLAMMSSYTYGLFPIVPMWIFKFTYGHIWLYTTVEIIFNAIFSFFVLPWFSIRGFLDFNAGSIAFILASTLAIINYRFQMWQEGIFIRSETTNFSSNLNPAAAKPLPDNRNDDPSKDDQST